MNNLLIVLGLKKPTTDSILSSFQKTATRLKGVVEQQDAEAARQRVIATDATFKACAANSEAARAHRIALKINELVA